uniref:Homeobox domain-containing protein n=1 Tax=Panagrellus redivivus TaxID=6233 RepID=A0A7E4UNN8_PANRE
MIFPWQKTRLVREFYNNGILDQARTNSIAVALGLTDHQVTAWFAKKIQKNLKAQNEGPQTNTPLIGKYDVWEEPPQTEIVLNDVISTAESLEEYLGKQKPIREVKHGHTYYIFKSEFSPDPIDSPNGGIWTAVSKPGDSFDEFLSWKKLARAMTTGGFQENHLNVIGITLSREKFHVEVGVRIIDGLTDETNMAIARCMRHIMGVPQSAFYFDLNAPRLTLFPGE